jgi:hypothetical protein
MCGIWPPQTTKLGTVVVVPFKQTMVKLLLCLASLLAPIAQARGQASGGPVANTSKSDQAQGDTNAAMRDVLPPEEWKRVDASVKRAMTWLISQQQQDGSFPTLAAGQPGVTSLCLMAFITHGHVPGKGHYGARLDRATDFVVSCQKRNGLVVNLAPDEPKITRLVPHNIGASGAYNHAISSLML